MLNRAIVVVSLNLSDACLPDVYNLASLLLFLLQRVRSRLIKSGVSTVGRSRRCNVYIIVTIFVSRHTTQYDTDTCTSKADGQPI